MYKLLLPRLGQTMEEGLLSQWIVEPGTEFDAGAHLYEVETEKVTTEVEATLPGTIVRVFVEAETTVDVGTLLAVVANPGEAPSDSVIDAFVASSDLQLDVASDAAAPTAEVTEAPTISVPGSAPVEPSPSSSTTDPGSGVSVLAYPRTREHARANGIDLSRIPGSGVDGLVTESDLASALAASRTPSATPVVSSPQHDEAAPTRVPLPANVAQRERRKLTSVARTMAQVTSRSAQQVAAFSQSVEIRARQWRDARDRLRDDTGSSIGYTDMILESVVRAVREVPEVNSSFDGDALVIWEDINISIAVDTDAGLLVPVLPKAHALDLVDRAAALTEVVSRARSGTLTSEDVSGGTITVSNLGMYGIEGGFPMVTAPQSAIIFVGAMHDAVVAVDGAIAVLPVFSLTNAFDHRALDGATAAKFTATLKKELEGWR